MPATRYRKDQQDRPRTDGVGALESTAIERLQHALDLIWRVVGLNRFRNLRRLNPVQGVVLAFTL